MGEPTPAGKQDKAGAGGGNELLEAAKRKREELNDQLKVYIEEWRSQRQKEDELLESLKKKQVKRKEIREVEERKMEEQQKNEEKRRQKEVEDKKKADAEEKLRKLEEAEKRRQAILKAEAEKAKSGPNFIVRKKEDQEDPAAEFKKTKEQLAEE